MALTLVRHTRPARAKASATAAPTSLAGSSRRRGATPSPPTPRPRRPRLEPARAAAAASPASSPPASAVPLTLDARLAEIDFGAWEGRPWAAIPRAELDAWAADLLHARPHGGESVAMLLARTRAALADLRATGAPCIAVTHAGVIRAALFVAGGDPAAWQRPIPYAEPIVLHG